VVGDVHARMQELTSIPTPNYEYLQLLRYEETQFYGQHHDYIPFHLERREGPRILTVFLYLNNVPAGGGTRFPLLDLVRNQSVALSLFVRRFGFHHSFYSHTN
jgi:prolyl 4-hydroxylase